MQIGYLVNSPWYYHSKSILRILQSNYNWCHTLDSRFTCTSKGVNSICTKVPYGPTTHGCAEYRESYQIVFCNMLH